MNHLKVTTHQPVSQLLEYLKDEQYCIVYQKDL